MSVRLGYLSKWLMVWLLVGGVCRSAVCDMVCALQVHRTGCHAEMPNGTAPTMEMTDADRATSISELTVEQTVAFAQPCEQGLCRHPSVTAMAKGSSPSLLVDLGEWPVVEILPVAMHLPSEERPSAVHRFHPADPLLLSLRV